MHRWTVPWDLLDFWTTGPGLLWTLGLVSAVLRVCLGRSCFICHLVWSVVLSKLDRSGNAAFCCGQDFLDRCRKKERVKCSWLTHAFRCNFLVCNLVCKLPCMLHVFFLFEFDSTLGFLGEGPKSQTPKLFTLISQNIGSINTNSSWKTLNADVCCLQETRIGKNNDRQSRFLVSAPTSLEVSSFLACCKRMENTELPMEVRLLSPPKQLQFPSMLSKTSLDSIANILKQTGAMHVGSKLPVRSVF